MLRVAWATQSRSGSQFLLQLTLKLLGSRCWPQARISGSRSDGLGSDRSPSFSEMYAQGAGLDYLRRNEIVAVKLEDPGIDSFASEVASAFPTSKWLASLRDLDSVLLSHHNIAKWGHDEQYVLSSFKGGIDFLEDLADQDRLFVVKVDEPSAFDSQRFCDFLGAASNNGFREVVRDWEPINDLRYQREKWGEDTTKPVDIPASLADLRMRHPWVPEIEARYEAVWQRCR